MSGNESPLTSHSYETIVVVGGGCYGSYYVTQLQRARAAGALSYDQILVVDKNPDCAIASAPVLRDPQTGVILQVAEWSLFFDQYLASANPESRDAIVPSPLMPHLMYEWLVHRAAQRWPGRVVETRPLPEALDLPWERAAPDGTHYGSFATWMCPINCIEPRRCPHTRGERTWSMPVAAEGYVTRENETSSGHLDGPVIFHCTHRAYGVGMFDTRDVVAGDAYVAAAGARGSADVLVGTVSHCHGAFNLLHVGA